MKYCAWVVSAQPESRVIISLLAFLLFFFVNFYAVHQRRNTVKLQLHRRTIRFTIRAALSLHLIEINHGPRIDTNNRNQFSWLHPCNVFLFILFYNYLSNGITNKNEWFKTYNTIYTIRGDGTAIMITFSIALQRIEL